MYINSQYPDPPPLPEVNAHYLFLKRPDQAEWKDYTFHVDPQTGRKRTYRQFLARIQDLATAMGAPISQGGLGLRAEDGEIVGIMSENCSDYITLVHSCLMLTTPFALIPSYSTPFELKHSLKLSKVTSLFVDANLLPLVLHVAKEVALLSNKIYVLTGHAKGCKSLSDLVEHVKAKSIPTVNVRQANKDSLAYLVFSSGTSGLPKAVMISHGNITYSLSQLIVLQQAATEVYTPLTPANPEGISVTLAFLPLHHTYGLFAYCFRPCLAQNTLVIMPKWDIELAFNAISRYKVSDLPLIPSIVHQIVNHPKSKHVDWSSVLIANSGAAYLPPDLAERMVMLVPKDSNFLQGYGMSEITIAAILQPLPGVLGGRLKHKRGSTGVLLPGIEARLFGDDGSQVEQNEPGELWLRSASIAVGYLNNKKANEETFVDGWLRTGDKFRVDEDGNFWFADRAKDTLKVSGSQVSPNEIEDILLAHPQKVISDVTVAGVSGGRTDDEKIPRAWVVLTLAGKKLGAAVVVEELEKWHQRNLSKYKWLRGGIEVVDQIPKSPTGKTLRRVLQDEYERQGAKNVQAKL